MTSTSLRPFFDVVSAQHQEHLDKLWAEALYTNNWPFNNVYNPFLLEFFKAIRPGWKPPSAYRLANSLLDDTHRRAEKLINEAMTKAPIVSHFS